jgi:hypothetical protein
MPYWQNHNITNNSRQNSANVIFHGQKLIIAKLDNKGAERAINIFVKGNT